MRIIMRVLLPLVFVCCATTSISAIRNKEVEPVTFGRIMVYAPSKDIGWRKEAETAFAEAMIIVMERKIEEGSRGARNPYYRKPYSKPYYKDYTERHDCGVRSIDIIPPFREYSSEDLRLRYSESEIDGILVVALEDFWTSDFQVFQPLSYSDAVIGYTVSAPRLRFDIRLVDVASGEVVWMASAVTAGSAFADREKLFKSLASSLVDELFEEDFLIREIQSSPE